MKKKIVLAFSGGLDTSIILKWLQNEYDADVVTFTADIGQGVEVSQAIEKAKTLGVKEIFVEDLREEFVNDYVFPIFRANTVYEGYYLLGTSIARPLIAKKQIEIARNVKAKYVSHGATGKGNDQVRFELGYYANNPAINVIAPWREWDLKSRDQLLNYAMKNQIEIPKDKLNEAPYSMDANLLHTSYEGKVLEDPWSAPDQDMFLRTVSPKNAPDRITEIILGFKEGDPVSINKKNYSPANLLTELNRVGGENGVGRLDIVENRYLGMKSRGVYETPGGEIILKARRAIESITLDGESSHLKDEIMPKYAKLVYNGYWFSPEREMLQALIDESQKRVNGSVKLEIYKGNVVVVGRKSDDSLYSKDIATFEEDDVFDQKDAEGFIKLNALRLKILKNRG